MTDSDTTPATTTGNTAKHTTTATATATATTATAAPDTETTHITHEAPSPTPESAPRAFVNDDKQWRGEDNVMGPDGNCIAHAVSYENQRWVPLSGWSTNVLPTDRYAWSCKDGVYERRREDWPVPDVWGHPSKECCWHSEEWRLETTAHTDHAGWEYAVGFGGPYSKEKTASCLVRRRVWKRAACVKPEFSSSALVEKAQSAHTVKNARINYLKRHEESRCKAHDAETKQGTSLQARVGVVAAELAKSGRHLKVLADNMEGVIEARRSVMRRVQKLTEHQLRSSGKQDPTTVSLVNPLQVLSDRLQERTHSSIISFAGEDGTELAIGAIRNLRAVCKHATSNVDSATSELRSVSKKLETAHKEAATQFEQTLQLLSATSVAAGDTQLWLCERKYILKSNHYSAVFESFKREAVTALDKLSTGQAKCVDVWQTAETEYWDMLSRTGFPAPPVEEDEHDVGTQTDDDVEHKPEEPSVEDVLKERATVPLMDSMHSEMVHKAGPLKVKGLTGYTRYLAVLTMDKYLYVFADETSKPYYTIHLTEAETHPRTEVCQK